MVILGMVLDATLLLLYVAFFHFFVIVILLDWMGLVVQCGHGIIWHGVV